jgi:MarR family transcriptional regulator, transcriptional regulator for hemolysin
MDLNTVIPFVIEQTSALAKQNSQKGFDAAKTPITVDQWILLKAIDENAGLTQVELAGKLCKSASSMTRTLEALDKKGLLKRERLVGNRKYYTIKLTNEGSHLMLKSMPIIEQTVFKGLQGLSKKNAAQLKLLLLRMKKNYSSDN